MPTRQALEDHLLLLEERVKRAASDPLLQWQPTPRQQPFLDAVLSTESWENWLIAANRAGKSDAGAYCGAQLARHGVPGQPFRPTSGWVVSLDYPSSRDIIQGKYFESGISPPVSHPPFIPQREIAEWRQTDQILRLKNGSIIGFKSADSGRLKFQGAEKDWIHFDEEPPRDIYHECVIRVGAGIRLRIFGTCTLLPPEGQVGGVSWLFEDLVKPWQEQRGHARIFTASIYDNPHLDPAEITRLESIYPEGSTARRIRLGGELLPGLSGARAYPAFTRAVHIKKQPEITFRRPLCWCWDFNVEPMVSVIGQRDGSVFRVHQEFVLEEGNVMEMVEYVRSQYPTHGSEVWVYGDATGKHRTAQTAQSGYQLILNAMRTYPAPVRLKVPDRNPLVTDRINAMNQAMRNTEGVTNVEIDPRCVELIADLEQVLRDVRGGIKKTTNRKDAYFRRTHVSDAVGYWVTTDEPVVAHRTLARTPMTVESPGYGFTR